MRGKFDRPPSATGYSCSSRQAEGPSPLRPRSQATAPVDGKTLLRPIFDLLLLAALLLPWKLWWYLAERECPNPSRAELVLLRVTRGVWIAWLTHAAGLLDEVVRVALGIRLTQGLGTPTSVDKVFSKMSRWAEVVAEVRFAGIAWTEGFVEGAGGKLVDPLCVIFVVCSCSACSISDLLLPLH